MALLKIARMGHPVLRSPARPVEDPTAPEIGRLIADMIDTMADAGGVGLAAPQVHVPLRLVVFFVPPSRTGEPAATADASDAGAPDGETPSGGVPLTVLINPVIEPLGEEMVEGWEACLSVPGLTGLVPRFRRIRYRGLDATGAALERVAEGFHARVVQHECDHLDGILYPRRLRDLGTLGFVDEMRQTGPATRQPG